MPRKELNLAIFEGRADRPLWQPRLEEWIRYARERNIVPSRFWEMTDLEICDALRWELHAPAVTIMPATKGD